MAHFVFLHQDVCVKGQFPSLIFVPSHFFDVKSEILKDISIMCLDLDL